MAKITIETLSADPTRLPEPDDKFLSIVTRPPTPRKLIDADGISSPLNLASHFSLMEDCANEWLRVLHGEGLLWLNLGDITTDGIKQPQRYRYRSVVTDTKFYKPPTQWANLPHKVLEIFTSCGWLYKSCIIWDKMCPNAGESKTQRKIEPKHEYLFMLAKDRAHRFFSESLVENSSVWMIPSSTGYKHKDTFPVELPRRCIPLSAQRCDWVLDPFSNRDGTTGVAAKQLGCNAVNYTSVHQGLEKTA
jgi:DNA modification methylase